jgi:hypothetical protein
MRALTLFVVVILLPPLPVRAQMSHGGAAAPAKPAAVTLDPRFGATRHPVTISSAAAQSFFDQGLNLLYGFNHDEALKSFQHAAALDPVLAMAY